MHIFAMSSTRQQPDLAGTEEEEELQRRVDNLLKVMEEQGTLLCEARAGERSATKEIEEQRRMINKQRLEIEGLHVQKTKLEQAMQLQRKEIDTLRNNLHAREEVAKQIMVAHGNEPSGQQHIGDSSTTAGPHSHLSSDPGRSADPHGQGTIESANGLRLGEENQQNLPQKREEATRQAPNPLPSPLTTTDKGLDSRFSPEITGISRKVQDNSPSLPEGHIQLSHSGRTANENGESRGGPGYGRSGSNLKEANDPIVSHIPRTDPTSNRVQKTKNSTGSSRNKGGVKGEEEDSQSSTNPCSQILGPGGKGGTGSHPEPPTGSGHIKQQGKSLGTQPQPGLSYGRSGRLGASPFGNFGLGFRRFS